MLLWGACLGPVMMRLSCGVPFSFHFCNFCYIQLSRCDCIPFSVLREYWPGTWPEWTCFGACLTSVVVLPTPIGPKVGLVAVFIATFAKKFF